jgi:hypothetical protein
MQKVLKISAGKLGIHMDSNEMKGKINYIKICRVLTINPPGYKIM